MTGQQNTPVHPSYDGCVSRCPLCGSDLYALESGCICKNPQCGWSCDKCKADDQP